MKKSILVIFSLVFASALFAQKATIDYRYNMASDDGKNYVNWSADGKSVKDTFDAATGASKAKTTTEFNVVRFDASGSKKAIPATLRYMMLFPVAARAVAVGDNFNVSANGKELTIRFIHRGNAFQVVTDKNGKINMNSFKMASGVGENIGGKFVLKDEFVKEGGDKTKMLDADWSKIQLENDVADADASYTYDGVLSAQYKNNVLTIKGNLVKKAK
ncbi:MAG: hypothetical protein IKI31_07080 [Treponema sp.]|nr:hypothetical protein [Treponema sp.]